MHEYEESRFQRAWQASKESAQRVLEREKSLHAPSDVAHTYQDKYRLAERLTTTALQALLTTLHAWGWEEAARAQCHQWATAQRASVQLEFHATETCVSRGTRKRKEPGTETVTSIASPRGIIASLSQRWNTRTTDYVWKYSLDYRVVAVRLGGDPLPEGQAPEVILFQQAVSGEVLTSVDRAPCPKSRARPPLSVDVTWLLQRMDAQGRVAPYRIARDHPHCYTPRRNPPIDAALDFARAWDAWASGVSDFFLREVYRYGQEERVDMASVQADAIFVPVLALFHGPPNSEGPPEGPPEVREVLLSEGEQAQMMGEQERSMQEKLAQLQKSFPLTKGELIGYPEVQRVVLLQHTSHLLQAFHDGVQLLEEMLRRQLVEAVGKSLQPADMAQYMEFHYRKMFAPAYQPGPLCYAVQRTAHHPEGVVSVEAPAPDPSAGLALQPIPVLTHQVARPPPMRVALDATTHVTLEGEMYVHTWINQRFSASPHESHISTLQLLARSGPFSSFLLLVGTLVAPDQLAPQAAILLQSRDVEVCIPLLAEDIPSAQAFRQASESLSPEQLAFVSAYRRMQLESTLFGLAVVQIKPQLEKVLRLPPDALTKPMALVEDLLELFLRYHIPSDLLSYDLSAHASPVAMVERVQFLVQEMKDMVAALQAEELAQAQQEAQHARDNLLAQTLSAHGGLMDELDGVELQCKSAGLRKKSKNVSRARKKESASPARRSSARHKDKAMPMERKEKKQIEERVSGSAASHKDRKGGKQERRASPPLRLDSPPPVSEDAPFLSLSDNHDNPLDKDQRDPLEDQGLLEGQEGQRKEEEGGEGYDVTAIPAQLDEALDLLDPEGALRAATLRAQTSEWKRTFRPSLLSAPSQETLDGEGVRQRKNEALDLLDILSRSGLLSFEHCQVHVLMATSHLFDRSLMDTLVCRNVNPIDRLSRSAYIVASVLHGHPAPDELLQPSHLASLMASSPPLFASSSQGDDQEEDKEEGKHEEEQDKAEGKKEEEEEGMRASRDRESRVSNAEVVSKIEAKLARLQQLDGQ